MNKVIKTDKWANICPDCKEASSMKHYRSVGEAEADNDKKDELWLGICKCGNVYLINE